MVSKELAIRQAAQTPNWEHLSAPAKAAIAIAKEISDRRGFDLDCIDEEIREDMIDCWTEIIRSVFRAEGMSCRHIDMAKVQKQTGS